MYETSCEVTKFVQQFDSCPRITSVPKTCPLPEKPTEKNVTDPKEKA